MRYVKLVVNDGQRGAVLSVLDEEDIDRIMDGEKRQREADRTS